MAGGGEGVSLENPDPHGRDDAARTDIRAAPPGVAFETMWRFACLAVAYNILLGTPFAFTKEHIDQFDFCGGATASFSGPAFRKGAGSLRHDRTAPSPKTKAPAQAGAR